MAALYYDVTHLRHNAPRRSISGVIRLDFEIARHFFTRRPDVRAIQYGVSGPSLVADVPSIQAMITHAIDQRRNGGRSPGDFQAIVAWLGGSAAVRSAPQPRATSSLTSYARFFSPPYWMRGQTIEPGSVYLNTAQHALAYPLFFRWLDARPDIKSIFLVHDLLPLDYPEYWRAGYRDGFLRAINVLVQVGRGFIVTSDAVHERLVVELARYGRSGVPILRSAPPVFLRQDAPTPADDATLSAIPYFVMLGMIEPRKNHLLILNIWRQLVERGAKVPKLVIIGKRGWENEQVVDMLDRSPALRGHVMEVANVSDADAYVLIRNARALLFPSFAEGFGLSVAEALAAGTPVIASDIPVLRETSHGNAILLHPLDGPGWTEAILGLADASGPISAKARALAAAFTPRPADRFLLDIEAFVEQV